MAKPKFEPAKLLKEEPTSVDGKEPAKCPHCGSTSFFGVDLDAVLTQEFESDGEYDSYDSEIGQYEYVTCKTCERVVWYDDDWFLPDAKIDRMLQGIERSKGPGCTAKLVQQAKLLLNGHRISTLLADAGDKETL